MVTTMVFAWRTILLGRCWPAEPLVLPPPWMNTSTDRSDACRRRSFFRGRHTSNSRRSSSSTWGPLDDASCAHGGDRRVASSGLLHGVIGAGGENRRSPTGG